jgi:hypothetical protein
MTTYPIFRLLVVRSDGAVHPHGHKGDLAGGNDKVTNPRQCHEKTPVDFESSGVHADDYKDQHGGPKYEEN